MPDFNLANLARSIRTVQDTPAAPRLTTGTAARALRVSREGVRYFVRAGQLPCEQTQSGLRLFQADDVRRLAEARARATLEPAPTIRPPRTEPRQLRLRLFRAAGRKVT